MPGAPSTEELLRAAPAAGPKRERTAEGIELINDTPLALGTVRWDLTPSRDCLTVVAKATCDLVAGGPAKLRAKADPLGGDRLVETGRGSVCVHPSDLVPYKVRADIGLVGHAHAPEGGTTSMQVRFALGQPPLGLDRTLLVFGPRTWEGAGALARPGKPGTFLQLPLRRDSAFGGPGHPENPAGLGFGAGAKGPVRPGKAGKPAPLPHLEDPKSRIRTPKQAPEPACFAPLSRAERELALKADKTPRSLADLFDWSRWQSAPRAMQLPFLAGDEPFEIEGVLPGAKGLSGALPGIAARCVAERASGREEIAMNLDTAIFDLDDRTLTLVWRGVLPVSSEPTPGVRALRLVTVPTEDRHAPLPD
ncbi:MAG: DUF2169 domain-containing protein [Polyangiaceae bacterium]